MEMNVRFMDSKWNIIKLDLLLVRPPRALRMRSCAEWKCSAASVKLKEPEWEETLFVFSGVFLSPSFLS